jgi:hypothetical protein
VVRITIGTTDFPFSKAPYHLWVPLSLLSKGDRGYIPGEERSGLEVNDSPLWLRNVEDVSVLPVRAFMVWTGKTTACIESISNVKVQFTPEQATKAQRRSRGIALLFP